MIQEAQDKPTCKLIGEDGNAFSIIGNVSRTLKQAGQREQATEFCERAFKATSYQELLALLEEYVEVE